MQNKDDLTDDPVQSDVQNDQQEPLQIRDKDSWLLLILGIPYIGGILTSLIGLLPVFLVMAGEDRFPKYAPPKVMSWVWLFLLPVLFFWLRFLERKAGLAICLPIPILNIRIKWLLLPLALIVLYGLYLGDPIF